MGRLIGLELENFKSYKGTSRIGFGNSFFTSVIGPNGAGKSNMMDAISFVLGVQTSNLRSHNLKSLIYRGRRENKSQNEEIEAVSNDVTRAHVMAMYLNDDQETVKLKRLITQSGTSEYQIDGKNVTALQYSLFLKRENILIKARNFLVFQGDVEQIASQSPKDLARVIETISGSNELQQEYDSLKEEAEKAHEFTNSVFSRRRILSTESKQYKEQMIEQELFEKKLVEKSDLIKIKNLYHLFHNEVQHKNLSISLEEKQNELNLTEKLLNEKQMLTKEASSKYAQQKLAQKKREIQMQTKVQKLEFEKGQVVPIEAQRKLLSSKINLCNSRINELSRTIQSQKSSTSYTRKQLKDAERLFNEFQRSLIKGTNCSMSLEIQNEYEELRQEYLSDGGSQIEEKLSLLTTEASSLESSIKSFLNQKQNANQRIEELENIIENELRPKIDNISAQINELLQIRSEKVSKREELVKAKDECNIKEMEINTRLRETLMQIEEISSRQRESKKRKNLRDTVSMLKSVFSPGKVKGMVQDLVKPVERKYDLALSTALGKQGTSIVVESTSIANKCIEILKERRTGTATFIPLDSLVNENLNLSFLRSIDTNAEPALDILSYSDPSLEQAVHYAIGDALVVKDTEAARRLKWDSNKKINYKLITLDGAIIHKNGLMTGGNSSQNFSTSSWDQGDLDNLYKIKDDLKVQLSKIENGRPKEIEINMIADEINELDDSLPTLRAQRSNQERIIEDRKTEINFQKQHLVQIEDLLDSAKIKKSGLDEQEVSIKEQEKELKQKIFDAFCNEHGFKNGVYEYEESTGSLLRSRAKERAQYKKTIDALANKLKFEEERLAECQTRNISINSSLRRYEDELERTVKARQEILDKIDLMEAEIKVFMEEEDEQAKYIDGMVSNANLVENEFKNIEQSVSAMNIEITKLQERLLNQDMERAAILKNCKIESINIPLTDGILDSIVISDNTESMVKNIYEIEIDYSMLEEKYREQKNSKLEAELQARIEDVVNEIEKLTPNSKALERLHQAEIKLKAFDKDFTSARQAENKVLHKFAEIKDKRYELFMAAFNHISQKIDDIYKDLTKATYSPLGGSAYLTLEDEEEPYKAGIKYHAMPPMKRFRDMDQLSGGEKTIAALALLFAIHSYHPSPFFVLDEVDAALDNSNVSRIANFIKKNAGPNYQFIVISLKNALFEKSDALVGVYRNQSENSSNAITLDLSEYPDDEASIA